MKKDNFNILSKYYARKKENKIKELDNKKKEYKRKIINIQQLIEEKTHRINKLRKENKKYKIKYERLKQIFYERGLTINIINKNYNIKEWDNLYLRMESNLLAIYLKDGKEVKLFDEGTTMILEELLKDKDYSLVATRVYEKFIKVQLHIR